jgi:hypothetical protein
MFPVWSAPPKELVAVPVTFKLVVVAVPETMRSVVEALVVAVKIPTVKEPRLSETVFAMFWRFPVKDSGT